MLIGHEATFPKTGAAVAAARLASPSDPSITGAVCTEWGSRGQEEAVSGGVRPAVQRGTAGQPDVRGLRKEGQ